MSFMEAKEIKIPAQKERKFWNYSFKVEVILA